MPAKLLFRDGQGMDASVDVPENTPIFLGRGADCAVRTDDAMVSRKNCKLSGAGGRFFVEDLGSSNGTFVNERRIQRQQLAHGDVIRCGTLQVRYVEVAGRPRTAAVEAAPSRGGSVEVNLPETGAEIAAMAIERDAAQKQLKEQGAELDTLRARTEAADAELKSLRQQAVTAREELARTKRDHVQDKEELAAVGRAAEELQVDSKNMREELTTLKARTEEQTEELAAKERQIERAQEEVQRSKQTTEELRNKLGEVQKTKDEGWRELNAQLSQVEHLREVIGEQERILEERRVGLIAIESAAKDLRAEKEKILRELVDTKNQRDDLKDRANRHEAKIEGLEEEHRRMARIVSSGGEGGTGEDLVKLANEMREVKVEYKKVLQEKERALENLGRVEAERDRLNDDKARLDVERAQLAEDKKVSDAARAKAEEARARAESLRQKLDEEKQAAAAARDTALTTAEEVRRELERTQKRVAELERGSGVVAAADALKRVENARDQEVVARNKAEARGRMLEQDLARAREELARAQGDLAGLRGGTQEMAAVQWPVEESTHPGGDGAAAGGAELRAKAQEIYDGINEALSELRTMILTAKGLFGEVGPRIHDEEMRKALGDAIANSMDRTEEAKGLLRGLKELAQR